ncbi:hypothetical protein Tsubulata_035386 [Turnera subulata]|uniref:Spindle and kinetochore-associated protein 3 n=1 Tax=Turnera subulata TaxID=218843 RepID=A0A9Q0F652_9ROSI|nr:hypothetical protein Tsubulata_035386 [Turnera subulata]
MEESIASLSKTLGSFCNHLQSSCDALMESVARRPIPLDSASSTFVQSLNRRVSSASSDLNLLESMSFGTVSFEELLGHCNEAYKSNHNRLLQLHHRLNSLGYLPSVSSDEEDEDSGALTTPDCSELKYLSHPPSAYSTSIIKSLEEDTLYPYPSFYSFISYWQLSTINSRMDESLSLKSLGLSDLCLATLASEGEVEEKPADDVPVARSIIEVSENDYQSLPSYIKNLTSWEELLTAVEKINASLRKKEKPNNNYFQQDEIASMNLGPKTRSYLLILTRMNQLVVEALDGSIAYKVL